MMQGRTSGVTAESTVLASHQVPYSDGVTRFGCSSYTYAPQRYIIYSNPTTRTWSEEMNESPRRYFQISTWKRINLHVETVLFLKKVHSWEGITEMVLGSFLLVLWVYSFVSFAPAGVHDLWSFLLRRYTKIGLCWELSDMGSEFWGSELLENCS